MQALHRRAVEFPRSEVLGASGVGQALVFLESLARLTPQLCIPRRATPHSATAPLGVGRYGDDEASRLPPGPGRGPHRLAFGINRSHHARSSGRALMLRTPRGATNRRPCRRRPTILAALNGPSGTTQPLAGPSRTVGRLRPAQRAFVRVNAFALLGTPLCEPIYHTLWRLIPTMRPKFGMVGSTWSWCLLDANI